MIKALMLNAMRRHAYSWGVKALFGLIVVVFMFWGMGTGFLGQVRPVAKVDGRPILADEVNRQASRMRRQLEQAYGSAAAEIAKRMNLQQQALEQIVDTILIDREAQRLGLEINDRQLQQGIESNSAFQVDGQFDYQTYESVLRANDMMPADFERVQRGAMLGETLKGMVEHAVQVSDEEARAEFNRRNEKLELEYIDVPSSRFVGGISPTAKELEDFYARNRDAFREPERRKIIYIHYASSVMAERVQPTQKEIEDYYTRYKSSPQFVHPEQVRARHILIAVASGASEAEKAEARKKAERILGQLKNGADFAKVAEKNSDDPGNKFKGGDLGLFRRGQMVKPFEDAAFRMKPGELALVETQFGYHILRVGEHMAAHTDSLEDARPRIVELLKRNSGSDMAHAALHEDLAAALDGKDLQSLAKKRGLEAVETPLFAQNEPLAGGEKIAHLNEAAFKMNEGEVRAVTGAGTDPSLVKLLKIEPSRIPAQKEIEAKVLEALVREQAEKAAHALADSILKQVKSVDDLAKVAAANKLPVRTTGEFSRATQSVPPFGQFPELVDAAAQVARVPAIVPRSMDHGGNSYVFAVTGRRPPSDDEWTQERSSFTEELLSARREDAWNHFVDSLKEHATITVDADQLGQTAESSM